jgi:hypothetical protein
MFIFKFEDSQVRERDDADRGRRFSTKYADAPRLPSGKADNPNGGRSPTLTRPFQAA